MAGFLPNQLLESILPSIADVIMVQKDGENEVKKITYENFMQKGEPNGVCPLDENALVSSAYLPSYVDDVIEYATQSDFPVTGESGKIYVALDTNKQYRWSGSAYIQITSGAVDSVNGKTGVVILTTADISDSTDKRYVTDLEKEKLGFITVTSSINLDNALLDSDIGVTVQAYDANLVSDANYVHTDNNYDDIAKAKVDYLTIDEVVDLTPAYGTMMVSDNTIAETTVDSTFRVVEAFDTVTVQKNVTIDTTNNNITITKAGDYKVDFGIKIDGGAQQFEFAIFKNGVQTTLDLKERGDTRGYFSIVTTFAANDVIDVRQKSTSGGTTLTVNDAYLTITKL